IVTMGRRTIVAEQVGGVHPHRIGRLRGVVAVSQAPDEEDLRRAEWSGWEAVLPQRTARALRIRRIAAVGPYDREEVYLGAGGIPGSGSCRKELAVPLRELADWDAHGDPFQAVV